MQSVQVLHTCITRMSGTGPGLTVKFSTYTLTFHTSVQLLFGNATKKENLESTCGHIRQTNIWQQTYTATGRDISDKVTALNVTKAE